VTNVSISLGQRFVASFNAHDRRAPNYEEVEGLSTLTHGAVPGQASVVRLLCFSPSPVGGRLYAGWNEALPDHIEVVPVHDEARDDHARHGLEPESRTRCLAKAIASRGGQTAFFGWDFAAITAFEAAWMVQRRGTAVAHLFVASCPAPHRMAPRDNRVSSAQNLVGPRNESTGEHRSTGLPVLQCTVSAFHATGDASVSIGDVRAWADVTRGRFLLRLVPGPHLDVTSDPQPMLDHIGDSFPTPQPY
jgi:surfactin synthase thioesterase subunit